MPILHALRERLGEVEEDKLVVGALRDWPSEQFQHVAAAAKGHKLDNWKVIWSNGFNKIDAGFEMDLLHEGGSSQDFNVTHSNIKNILWKRGKRKTK